MYTFYPAALETGECQQRREAHVSSFPQPPRHPPPQLAAARGGQAGGISEQAHKDSEAGNLGFHPWAALAAPLPPVEIGVPVCPSHHIAPGQQAEDISKEMRTVITFFFFLEIEIISCEIC